MKLKLSRILDLLFGDKTPKVTSEIDVLVGELESIAKSIANDNDHPHHDHTEFPTVQWGCPVCDGKWFCFKYSRDFIPAFCTYCGVKFESTLESEIEKAGFLYEKAKSGE